jgi:endonuclease YncB( thermonuclease family)
VLPIGTLLTRLHDAPRNFPEPRLLATVPKPPAACATRVAGKEVAIPTARIRQGPADNAARSAPQPKPADADALKPAPSSGRAVSGAVQGLSAEGWPNVAGQVVRLQGLTAIAPEQRKRFESWLAGHENTLQCEPQAGGTYRCLTKARADVAEALLLNGAATATGDAPAAYKDAMARAMAEKRGLWK